MDSPPVAGHPPFRICRLLKWIPKHPCWHNLKFAPSIASNAMHQSTKDQITVLMSAASTIRAFELLRGADFTQQQFNCYADDYDGKYDRKTLDFAYKSLRLRPLVPTKSRFFSLFRRPKPQSRCLADEIEEFTRQRLSKPETVEMYRKIFAP